MIVFNVHVSTGSASYPNVDFKAETISGTETIDTTALAAGQLIYLAAVTPKLTLSNPNFATNVDSAADYFTLDLSVNRDIFKYDRITLDLGTLSTSNSDGVRVCKIFTEEGAPSTKWSSCTITNLEMIQLAPITDIATGEKFTLKLPRVINMATSETASTGITGNMKDSSSTTIT